MVINGNGMMFSYISRCKEFMSDNNCRFLIFFVVVFVGNLEMGIHILFFLERSGHVPALIDKKRAKFGRQRCPIYKPARDR